MVVMCRATALGWAGLGHTLDVFVVSCALTCADVSNEVRHGSQGFQHAVHFCDTISELVSPPLVTSGGAGSQAASCGSLPGQKKKKPKLCRTTDYAQLPWIGSGAAPPHSAPLTGGGEEAGSKSAR